MSFTSLASVAQQLAGATIPGALTVTGSVNAGSSPGGPLPELVATTGAAGFALTGGTPTIISWTAPNDGNDHRAIVYGGIDCTSAATGGSIGLTGTQPGGSTFAPGLVAANSASGSTAGFVQARVVAPGTTISVVQTAALTAGAITCWAEILAS